MLYRSGWDLESHDSQEANSADVKWCCVIEFIAPFNKFHTTHLTSWRFQTSTEEYRDQVTDFDIILTNVVYVLIWFDDSPIPKLCGRETRLVCLWNRQRVSLF